MFNPTTLTQGLFLCCLFVFGPFYGFWAAYRAMDSRLGRVFSFLFATFCAYAGWFVSGVAAQLVHPNYPEAGPAETIAALYAIPGFITGYLGLMLLDRLHAKRRIN